MNKKLFIYLISCMTFLSLQVNAINRVTTIGSPLTAATQLKDSMKVMLYNVGRQAYAYDMDSKLFLVEKPAVVGSTDLREIFTLYADGGNFKISCNNELVSSGTPLGYQCVGYSYGASFTIFQGGSGQSESGGQITSFLMKQGSYSYCLSTTPSYPAYALADSTGKNSQWQIIPVTTQIETNAAPKISFDSLADFGNAGVGSTAYKKIKLLNNTGAILQITGIEGLTAPFSVVNYTTTSIDTTGEINLAYNPVTAGAYTQWAIVKTSAGNVTIPVKALCSTGYVIKNAPGKLKSLVLNTATDSLTVYGSINSDDLDFIKSNLPNLKYLNLATANLVSYNNKTVLTLFPRTFSQKVSLTEVVLPFGINTLEMYAFNNCTALKHVTLPSTLTTINSNAFYNTPLEKIEFPASLKTIGSQAFYQCKLTGTLVFPDSLYSIGSSAFYGNSCLQEVVFNNRLQSIDDNAFSSCPHLRKANIPSSLLYIGKTDLGIIQQITLASPIPLLSQCTSFITCTVPAKYLSNYQEATEWQNVILIGDNPVKVSVDVEQEGSLMDKIVAQTGDVNRVNEITIKGSLNSTDADILRYNMKNLYAIDLSQSAMTTIPNNFVCNNKKITSVKLPAAVTTIGDEAFDHTSITSVDIPSTVTAIGSEAFAQTLIEHIQLPDSLKKLGSYAFHLCTSLDSVIIPPLIKTIPEALFLECNALKYCKLPSHLTSIMSEAFSSTGLTSIDIPEGVDSIENQAFQGTSIKKFVIPSTVVQIDYPFNSPDTIIFKVTVPPLGTIGSSDLSNTVLCVPAISLSSYQANNKWAGVFKKILPISGYEPSVFDIVNNFTFSESMRPTNKPDVNTYLNSILRILGDDELSLGTFTYGKDIQNTSSYYEFKYPMLISETSKMRADSVFCKFSVSDYWLFITPPFDVKVSDIIVTDKSNPEGLFAIRKYNGATRAAGNPVNWEEMTTDSVLHYGIGYAIKTYSNSYSHTGDILLKAINNTNKNNIFTNADIYLPLYEYDAEKAIDRSWNLIGNPYPCNYDIAYMDYTAPLTVYTTSGSTNYIAYSPTDDILIMDPFQAFFVQKPYDKENLHLYQDGRQTDKNKRNIGSSKSFFNTSGRSIYNFVMSSTEGSDRTRVVINESASLNYELTCDAAKFMNAEARVPQVFSIDAAEQHLAINERPLANKQVRLGFVSPSDGTYKLTLATRNAQQQVVLKDNLTARTLSLADGQTYEFTSGPGTFLNRFEVSFTDLDAISATKTKSSFGVKVVSGQLFISIPSDEQVNIYTTGGALVKSFQGQSGTTIVALPTGEYIIKAGSNSAKVLIK